MAVHPDEVFEMNEATEVFLSYFRNGQVDERYVLSEVMKWDKDGNPVD